MKIFYVHHAGRKTTKSQSSALARLGVQDAKTIAKVFAKIKDQYPITAIYSSTFLRCKKTAEMIGKKLNVPIFEDARLNEFKSVANETWVDCQKRTMSLLKEIVFSHSPTDNVLCVTSGVNLTAFIAAAFNLQPDENLPFPIVPTCSPIGFEISKNNFQ